MYPLQKALSLVSLLLAFVVLPGLSRAQAERVVLSLGATGRKEGPPSRPGSRHLLAWTSIRQETCSSSS